MLFTTSVKRVVVPGFVELRTTNTASGPSPAPGAPGSAEFAVRSTLLAVIAVNWSVAFAFVAGLIADVAVLVTVYGPPVEPEGSCALRMTLYDAPAASGPVSGMPLPFESVSSAIPLLW